jgi:hypothetical protein
MDGMAGDRGFFRFRTSHLPGIPYAVNASYARNLVEIARCSILVENHYPRKGRMR